jgi:hypothetical protein
VVTDPYRPTFKEPLRAGATRSLWPVVHQDRSARHAGRNPLIRCPTQCSTRIGGIAASTARFVRRTFAGFVEGNGGDHRNGNEGYTPTIESRLKSLSVFFCANRLTTCHRCGQFGGAACTTR